MQLEAQNERLGCHRLPNLPPCLDLIWTNVLSGWPYYLDSQHFNSHLYTLFNQQLFRLLKDLELGQR